MENREFSDISFKEYLSEEKLMGSTCEKCAITYTPPRAMCSRCREFSMTWTRMQGTGKLAAFTCINIGPRALIEEGYDRDNPYCVGVVELDEGTRVVARIEGIDAKRPEDIRIGTPLKVKFLHRSRGIPSQNTILAFEPL
ncbi:MAG: OB-fold domain-containing protein [Syntrophales bacterium]|jgi:uncharacterized OB-fold protein|nr:OB-fold domain-containing protein [Syntrophales bacterium]MDX9922001.1 OB-fold domain-containing protein [Syntrophales bacterium]